MINYILSFKPSPCLNWWPRKGPFASLWCGIKVLLCKVPKSGWKVVVGSPPCWAQPWGGLGTVPLCSTISWLLSLNPQEALWCCRDFASYFQGWLDQEWFFRNIVELWSSYIAGPEWTCILEYTWDGEQMFRNGKYLQTAPIFLDNNCVSRKITSLVFQLWGKKG